MRVCKYGVYTINSDIGPIGPIGDIYKHITDKRALG